MLASAVLLPLGCDASVTSVGAWQPIVEQPTPNLSLYLEAESGQLSGGFSAVSDASASNGQYLQPPIGMASDMAAGPARAVYSFTAPADAEYIIWGRIWSPSVSSNRFWFQVDDGEWHLWRISVGEIWYWDDLHEDTDYYRPFVVSLVAGPHTLRLANAVAGAKLDRLYITADGDEPPGNATPCFPPHSIEIGGECQPSCGSHATGDMTTTCLADVCMTHTIVEAYDCNICCLVPMMP
jgi:hypothetical protein